jgi:glycerol dehydrogenase
MTRIFRSPSKYVQGIDELARLYEHLAPLGKSALFLVSEGGRKRCDPIINEGMEGKDFRYDYYKFQGECCYNTVKELEQIINDFSYEIIVGIGGGKILDTAKAVSFYAGIPVVIIPTVASTDAPCSALSVLYHEDGIFDRYLFLAQNPNLVLVDSKVIVKAPTRLFVAGMGDALSTYFEARAVQKSGKNNQVGAKPCIAGFAMAKTCYQILLRDGLEAKTDVEKGACSILVENIIEVNTYLSSVGFESGGLAAAHALQKGLTLIPELHQVYHGEKVAFCTLVQLVLENSPILEKTQVLKFCKKVGLPVCFVDMGISRPPREVLMKVAEKACAEGSTINNMPFVVTPQDLCEAIMVADEMGQAERNPIENL